MEAMKEDTRHVQKVRDAGNRDISSPADPSAKAPPAKAKVTITTPARHAGRTMSPVGRR